MPRIDKYPNFAALAQHEQAGIDYRIAARRARPEFAVVAPHGGGIEPGTSELTTAIAGEQLSFYVFEGLKPALNGDLHITSTRFDEPLCLNIVAESAVVVTLHGEASNDGSGSVFLGGLDTSLMALVRAALELRDFDVRVHPDLHGLDPDNLCNRGKSTAGVQLELSLALRRTLFESLSASGRKRPTQRFAIFVAAVQEGLMQRGA
jgi:phage replication-related protein YjqB (UPF0714/DUF867 family)